MTLNHKPTPDLSEADIERHPAFKRLHAPKPALSERAIAHHPAFKAEAMTGYSLEMWRIKESLIHWDTLFALGFTSYKAFLTHVEKHQDIPLDAIREILVRLYLLEPEFPRLFVSPPITDMLDYLFKLNPSTSAEERKKCSSLIAPLFDRNRGSGYRWLRNKQYAENPVTLPMRKLSAKLFSMEPTTSREYFWRATFATARARSVSTDAVKELLTKNGVTFD